MASRQTVKPLENLSVHPAASIARHADLDTTQRYIHLSKGHLEEAQKKIERFRARTIRRIRKRFGEPVTVPREPTCQPPWVAVFASNARLSLVDGSRRMQFQGFVVRDEFKLLRGHGSW